MLCSPSSYLLLTEDDIKEWQIDPESWCHDQDSLSPEDKPRQCAEALLTLIIGKSKGKVKCLTGIISFLFVLIRGFPYSLVQFEFGFLALSCAKRKKKGQRERKPSVLQKHAEINSKSVWHLIDQANTEASSPPKSWTSLPRRPRAQQASFKRRLPTMHWVRSPMTCTIMSTLTTSIRECCARSWNQQTRSGRLWFDRR